MIRDKIKGLKRALNDLDGIFLEIVKKNEKFILDLNRRALLEGRKANNESTGNYSAKYAKRKGKTTSHRTFFDTGDYHRSFDIEYGDDNFKITSDDWKVGFLDSKYPETRGLDSEGKRKLAAKIKPLLQKHIKNALKTN